MTRNTYSVVMTQQFNPSISKFSTPCHEFTSVWSMFPYNTISAMKSVKWNELSRVAWYIPVLWKFQPVQGSVIQSTSNKPKDLKALIETMSSMKTTMYHAYTHKWFQILVQICRANCHVSSVRSCWKVCYIKGRDTACLEI